MNELGGRAHRGGWLLSACVVLVAGLAVPRDLAAQRDLLPRPKLSASADTLDSRSYYDWATSGRVKWKDARNAFFWASRLEPDEPKYARSYLRLSSPSEWGNDEEQLDSAAFDVMVQDPFPRERTTCLYMGAYKHHRNRLGVAYLHFNNGCYPQADTIFEEVLTKDPSLLTPRIYRAAGLYWMRKYDQAAAELQVLLDSLRVRDTEHLVQFYQSKAVLEYMRGMILARGRDFDQANDAFARALTEDLSFYMAHVRLAEIAADNRKPTTAANEYAMAVELRPANSIVRCKYGTALVVLHRFEEAETELREAIRIEPYWAEPYYQLGLALEGQERYADAITAFNDFVARTPRRRHVWAERAQAHVQAAEAKVAAAGGRSQ